MKGKFLWTTLMLGAALVACTDDNLDGNQTGNQGNAGGSPAYLTISFSANSGSSTRAVNDGDNHGTADDSGHSSIGITGESTITSALVVVAPESDAADADGFAKLYTVAAAASAGDDDFTLVDQATSTYGTKAPITINTGTYNVMVVLNPTNKLTDSYNASSALANGLEDVSQVRALYDEILTGDYAYTPASGQEATYPDNYTNAANSIGMGVGYNGTSTDDAYFMMANKAAEQVIVTTANTPENPAPADVTVERVLSKITFREKAEASGTAANAYEVKVNLGSAPAITTLGAIQKPSTDPAEYDIHTLNQATDALGNTIYALYAADGKLTAVYKQGTQTWTDTNDEYEQDPIYIYTALTAKASTADDFSANTDYAVIDTNSDNTLSEDEIAASIHLEMDPTAPTQSETWYVQLKGYALVNLAKTVNYVRHTIAEGSALQEPFGTLGSNRYLWTPNFEDKNALNVTTDFTNSIQAGWYYNSLKAVSDESKTMTVGTGGSITWTGLNYFKALSTLIDDDSEVEGETSPEPNTVGKLMTYCFENSTDQTHQVHGLSTGISFVAQIYKDAACQQPIDKLYLYADHNYTTLAQIEEAYGSATPQAIKNLINGTTQETPENLAKAGITLYSGNTCYYYSNEIKHFDNADDNELGVNEFIIMRNNIYSLSVSTIKEIGAPFVDPTPSTPNESTEAAIDINVQLEPWIVRYNDIEF